MKLITRQFCPLCQEDTISPFQQGTIDPTQLTADHFRITDNAYGSLWSFSRCRNCQFVFSNPTLGKSDIIQFYANLEDSEYSDETEGRSKNFKSILKQLEKFDKPDKTLLDIGAASGIFLNLAQDFEYQSDGIEPSEYLVSIAKREFGIELFQGTIDTFPATKRYSVITLLDILEHLVDPVEFFNQLDPMIKTGGILVIVTPDVDSMTARFFKKKWWHYRIAHINFFNLHSLQFLLEKHGYEIIKKRRYAWNFSLYYLLTRIFPGLKKRRIIQKISKKMNIKLQLFDSWEIYAKKQN